MPAKKTSRLGRGLSSLLGDVPTNIPTPAKSKADAVSQKKAATGPLVQEIEINLLKAGKYQPRTLIEQEKLQELSESIRQQGVISPIIVRPIASGRYEIIAGERRYRASRLAGKKTVPAIVREVDDKNALAMALIENMQREDLNAVEEAMGVSRLIEEFGYTHEQAAEAIGRSRSATTNLLRLLNLTEAVKQMLADGKIDMGHARALLALAGAEQIQVANEVVAKDLSVRETERLIARLAEKNGEKKDKKVKESSGDNRILEERLADSIGAPVRVVYGKKGRGKIVIDFADLDDLDALIAKFEDVRADILSLLTTERALDAAEKDGQALLAKIKSGEAKDVKFDKAVTVSRSQPLGWDFNLINSLMRVPAKELPAYIGVRTPTGYTLVHITKSETVEPDASALEGTRNELAGMFGQAEENAYLDSLRAKHNAVVLSKDYLPGAEEKKAE